MKSISLKKSLPMDLFGLVVLQPGPNTLDPAVWAKVKDLKLGAMGVPYVQYARAEGILSFEDESPALADESVSAPREDAPQVQAAGAEPESVPAPAQPAEPAPKKRGRPPKGA